MGVMGPEIVPWPVVGLRAMTGVAGPELQTSVNDLVFDEGVSKFSSSDCGIFREHPNWLDFLRYR